MKHTIPKRPYPDEADSTRLIEHSLMNATPFSFLLNTTQTDFERQPKVISISPTANNAINSLYHVQAVAGDANAQKQYRKKQKGKVIGMHVLSLLSNKNSVTPKRQNNHSYTNKMADRYCLSFPAAYS